MKKVNIIKESKDFTKIIKSNKPFKMKEFVIYSTISGLDYYKFGLSVSKKVGNAVIRNKIKRQLKSIIDKKHYKKGLKCIIIVRKDFLDYKFEEVEKDLFFAFEKLNIIEEKTDEK